jgi:predicted ATPase
MIKNIVIRNFKSIKRKHFGLKNLNVLLGLNGQGKSSFIQSLLTLRQSDRLQEGELKLGGKDMPVNIGSIQDALYQYTDDENLSISIQFDDSDYYEMEFEYQPETDVLKQTRESLRNVSILTGNIKQPLFTNNFQYLNAQRFEPQSINPGSYSTVMEANDLGKYGQYTAHYLELRGSENICFDNLVHKDSVFVDVVTGEQLINRTLINQVNLWLGEISPGVTVKTSKVTSDVILLEYAFKQPNLGSTNRFKPENTGFGISYALHIITAILASRPGELIIIENPESHIHPRGQAEMGKLIALAAQNDIQIIVETHSDHIINGIRVVVKEQPELANRTKLFYFEKVIAETEQYSRITDIEIDRNGTLSSYPQHLLSEWSNQLSKLI